MTITPSAPRAPRPRKDQSAASRNTTGSAEREANTLDDDAPATTRDVQDPAEKMTTPTRLARPRRAQPAGTKRQHNASELSSSNRRQLAGTAALDARLRGIGPSDTGSELWCEDVPLTRIADSVGTPAYVYSSATLARHYRTFVQAFAPRTVVVAYAVKANANLSCSGR